MRVIKTNNFIKKIAQTEINTSILDGKPPAQARRKLMSLIHKMNIPNTFRDDGWGGKDMVVNGLRNQGINVDVEEVDYNKNEYDGTLTGKRWRLIVSYYRDTGKQKIVEVYGTIQASGKGSVKDPLSEYDIVAYF